MSTIETGGAVFPLYDHHSNGQQVLVETGMTLRDYFAAKAMQGLIVGVEKPPTGYIARAAYVMADAMLAARK